MHHNRVYALCFPSNCVNQSGKSAGTVTKLQYSWIFGRRVWFAVTIFGVFEVTVTYCRQPVNSLTKKSSEPWLDKTRTKKAFAKCWLDVNRKATGTKLTRGPIFYVLRMMNRQDKHFRVLKQSMSNQHRILFLQFYLKLKKKCILMNLVHFIQSKQIERFL